MFSSKDNDDSNYEKRSLKYILIYNINMKEETKVWLEAGRILEVNPKAIINCPHCNTGTLKVIDEPIKAWNKIDRYLLCESCGHWNVITMNKPDE